MHCLEENKVSLNVKHFDTNEYTAVIDVYFC